LASGTAVANGNCRCCGRIAATGFGSAGELTPATTASCRALTDTKNVMQIAAEPRYAKRTAILRADVVVAGSARHPPTVAKTPPIRARIIQTATNVPPATTPTSEEATSPAPAPTPRAPMESAPKTIVQNDA